MQIRKCMRMKRTCWMDPCVAGVVEDKPFIVLTPYGETGYMPQEWFFEGNG